MAHLKRKLTFNAAVLLLVVTGCLPTFEDADCYADFDCPGNLVCREQTCQMPERDAGPSDAGTLDAAPPPPDSGPMDAGFTDSQVPDMGFEDASMPDAEPPPDSGPVDTGVVDAGTPDAGFDVRLEPAAVDFSVVRIGCAVPARQLTLRNVGPTAVQITSLGTAQGTSGEFSVTGRATPFSLASGGSEMLTVNYVPQNVGIDTGAADVTFGNPAQLVSSSLRAEGVVSGVRTDTFTQSGGPIDILFVVHNTSNMDLFQRQLGDDLTFLMLVLAFEGWDYQVGVTTADLSAAGAQGALLGTPPFLTAQDANVEASLAMRINAGTTGALSVQGMEAARLALSPPLSTTGANMGFLRPDAALLVVFLGDEDDASPMMVANYAAFLNGLKGVGNSDTVAANSIVSGVTLCSSPEGTATYSGRYLGLAPLTGGVFDTICDSNYQAGVSTMPPAPLNQRFPLDAIADPMTISVQVSGANVPSNGGSNWSYDGSTNEVVFSPAQAPALGATVQIDYSIACI